MRDHRDPRNSSKRRRDRCTAFKLLGALIVAISVLGTTSGRATTDEDLRHFLKTVLDNHEFVRLPRTTRECAEEGPACDAFRAEVEEIFRRLHTGEFEFVPPKQTAQRIEDLTEYDQLKPQCDQHIVRRVNGDVVDFGTIWDTYGENGHRIHHPDGVLKPGIGDPSPLIYEYSYGSRIQKPFKAVTLYELPPLKPDQDQTLYVLKGLDWRSQKSIDIGKTQADIEGILSTFELPSCVYKNRTTFDTHRLYSDDKQPPDVHDRILVSEYVDYVFEEYRGEFYLDEHHLAEVIRVNDRYFSLIVESSWGGMRNFMNCPEEQYVIRLDFLEQNYELQERGVAFYSSSPCGPPWNKYN